MMMTDGDYKQLCTQCSVCQSRVLVIKDKKLIESFLFRPDILWQFYQGIFILHKGGTKNLSEVQSGFFL